MNLLGLSSAVGSFPVLQVRIVPLMLNEDKMVIVNIDSMMVDVSFVNVKVVLKE